MTLAIASVCTGFFIFLEEIQMEQSPFLTKIINTVKETKEKRQAIENYKVELEDTKRELEKARQSLDKTFSFKNDKKVYELEAFVVKMEERYNSEKQQFEEEIKTTLKKVEEDFYYHVHWLFDSNEEVEQLEKEMLEAFNTLLRMMNKYVKIPKEINKAQLKEVLNDDFKYAFGDNLTYIGLNSTPQPKPVTLNKDIVKELFNTGDTLGLEF